MKPHEYTTRKGRRFGAHYTGPTPVELFDAGKYAECAHACMFVLSRIGEFARILCAIEDDSFLHELMHLTCGIEICSHDSMADIRSEIEETWEAYKATKSVHSLAQQPVPSAPVGVDGPDFELIADYLDDYAECIFDDQKTTIESAREQAKAMRALAQQPSAGVGVDSGRISDDVMFGWRLGQSRVCEKDARRLASDLQHKDLAQQPAACTACNDRREVGGATPEGFETHPCPECAQQLARGGEDGARKLELALESAYDAGAKGAPFPFNDCKRKVLTALAQPRTEQPAGGLSNSERGVIETLLNLAYAAWCLADNTGDDGSEGLTVVRSDFSDLEKQLNALDELPDDQPGYTMGEAAKARWALRRLLQQTATEGPGEVVAYRWRRAPHCWAYGDASDWHPPEADPLYAGTPPRADAGVDDAMVERLADHLHNEHGVWIGRESARAALTDALNLENYDG